MTRDSPDERIQYRGIRRDGRGTCGSTTEPCRRLVKRLHDQGWRRLIVTRDRNEVGWIAKLIDGKRVWWIDDTQT